MPRGVPIYLQPKLNGVRALAGVDAEGRWRFQSRDQLPWDYPILRHLSDELDRLGIPSDYVLDGELYVHGWPLQRINGAITPIRKEVSEDTPLVSYHVFDRVHFQLPFHARYETIASKLPRSGLIVPVQTRTANSGLLDAEELYAQFVSEGYEGMMYRIGDCPYTRPKQIGSLAWSRSKFLSDKDNRTWHLLKRKDWQDDEFECVGVLEGGGKRAGMVGAFICHNNQRPFNVGSFLGFTDADLVRYFQNPPIGRKLKVKYLTMSSGGLPLNPTLLAVL